MHSSLDKLALSFSAAFVGWCAGLAWFVVRSVLGEGFGYVTDFDAVAMWSGLFTLVAWAAGVVPVARFVGEERALYGFPWSTLFGGACGLLLCAAFLVPIRGATELLGTPVFLGQAFPVGAVSWSLYACAARRARPHRHAALAGWLLPPIALGVFAFAVWPALERVAPAAAYRFGSDDARHRLFERTLRELRVGDSIEMLRERLPGEFAFETTRTTGNRGAHLSYTIEFAEGRVTKVELVEKP